MTERPTPASRGSAAPPDRPAPRHTGPIVVARGLRQGPASAAEDVGGGLRRASFPTTAWRLLVRPNVHPWLPGWRLGRSSLSRLGLAAAALLLLAAWLLRGCGGAALREQRASLDAPAGTALCDTVTTPKQKLSPASRGEHFTLTFDRIPAVRGATGKLVVSPRDAAVARQGEKKLGETFDVTGPTFSLDLEPANGRWPEGTIEVQLEVTGPFHGGDALSGYLRAAADDAARIERRFEQQSGQPAGGVTDGEGKLIDDLAQSACRAESLKAAVEKGRAALDALEATRASVYGDGKDRDPVADGAQAAKAWIEAREAVAAAAREAGTTAEWLKLDSEALRFSAEHLAQLGRIGSELKEPGDKTDAVAFLAYALAPEGKLEERRRRLPPLRSLDDAVLRQSYRSIARGLPLPVPLASEQKPRDWVKSCALLAASKPGEDAEQVRSSFSLKLATLPGRQPSANACAGQGGLAAVPDQEAAAQALRGWLGMGKSISIASADQIAAASAKAQCARRLLCAEPSVDASALFFLEPGSSLAPVRDRLHEVKKATPAGTDPAVSKELDAGAGSLFCDTAGDRKLPSQVKTIGQYKKLLEGARDLFEYAPAKLPCEVTPAALRARFRQRWLELLSRSGSDDKLCLSRSGVCPARIAERVQSMFGLGKRRLATPVGQGPELEYPPPFGFIRPFIEKLRRCKVCEELSDVRRGIPGADLAGEECPAEADEDAVQSSLEVGPPGEVTSIELPGCDLAVPARLKLKLKRGAGRVVSILSPRPFKLNGAAIGEKRLHAQLGWAYVRTGDIDDPELFADREARLSPSEPDQKFYFLSLRTAAY